MAPLSDQLSRLIVVLGFARWSNLAVAVVAAFVLLVFGASPSSGLFWIIIAAAVAPFVLLDAGLTVHFARHGTSYSQVKREAARLTLEEMRRRKEAKRLA